MTWFKVDDNLAFHRKVVAAGNAAMGLWVRAGSWCAQQLTDGHVPEHMIGLLGTPAQAAKLVKAGLWVEVAGGYEFHQWAGRQPTAKAVRDERERNAARQADFRERRRAQANVAKLTTEKILSGTNDATPEENPADPAYSQVSASRNGVTPPLVTPLVTGGVTGAPTRPDPYKEKTTPSGVVSAPRKRGSERRATRLPDDFAITPEMVAWARENTPHVDGRRETEQFRDYWRAASGRNATKRDWTAAWRTWMRNAQDRARATPARNGHAPRTADDKIAQLRALKDTAIALPGGNQ